MTEWVAGGPAVETPFASVPGLLGGECVTNEHTTYLEVSVREPPSPTQFTAGYHPLMRTSLASPTSEANACTSLPRW